MYACSSFDVMAKNTHTHDLRHNWNQSCSVIVGGGDSPHTGKINFFPSEAGVLVDITHGSLSRKHSACSDRRSLSVTNTLICIIKRVAISA